jgi:hypothetical protein
VAVVRTHILEECITSIISVTRIGSMLWLLVTADVPSLLILGTLMVEMMRSSDTSILTKPNVTTSKKTTFLTVVAILHEDYLYFCKCLEYKLVNVYWSKRRVPVKSSCPVHLYVSLML